MQEDAIVSITVFGLTGGVASGKSTVAARFREQGLEVVDADRLAREVVAPGSEGLAAVVAAFGAVLTTTGELDRAKVRTLVLQDPGRRRTLEAILHPRIAAAAAKRIGELAAAGTELACYEAALLVENGLADAFRPLVVVVLDPAEQRRRLMLRDGSSAEDAERLLAAQLPLADKAALADYVIDNAGSRDELLVRSDEVLEAIRRRALGKG